MTYNLEILNGKSNCVLRSSLARAAELPPLPVEKAGQIPGRPLLPV